MTETDRASDADNDEALRVAIAMSLQDQGQGSTSPATKAPATKSPPAQGPQQSETPFTLLSLNRRVMEEERLARMARKRARSPSDNEVVEVPPPRKKPMPAPSRLGAAFTDSALPFPNGTVKRTWVRGFPRTGDDIKIEEVLQKDKLLLAMLSSYQWDDEWILSKVDVAKTKLLLAAFASDDRQKEAMRANVPPHTRFCFPQMHGPGSMHSKLQVLKFAHYLRVVVPTGNLVPYDWGETGVMENMVFLIDLPRLDKAEDHKPTSFSLELQHFLRAMGVDGKMVDSLAGYDFSQTASLGFVHTRPGVHTDESLKRVGYCGLGATVAALGLATTEPIEIDVVACAPDSLGQCHALMPGGNQCASLGSIKCDLLEAMYGACQGDDGMREFKERTSRKPRSKHSAPSQLLKDRFRIYFPANQTVCNSLGGKAAAGTICVQAKWWRSPEFPTELVRDCVNTREGLLMHSKVVFVRQAEGSSQSSTRPSWAYVGSANLSESAWGRLVKDKKSGQAKMSCRNWECGVVVPVVGRGGSRDGHAGGPLDIFRGTIPVPMQVPGRAYRSGEEPWFYDGA